MWLHFPQYTNEVSLASEVSTQIAVVFVMFRGYEEPRNVSSCQVVSRLSGEYGCIHPCTPLADWLRINRSGVRASPGALENKGLTLI